MPVNAQTLRQLSRSYRCPAVRLGDFLQCEIRGLSEVTGWHDGTIVWPETSARLDGAGRRSIIVTADLVMALRTELVSAICYHWGVSRSTVKRWKNALGIGESTATHSLRDDIRRELAADPEINGIRRESGTRVENVELLRRVGHLSSRTANLPAARRSEIASAARKARNL